MPESIGTILTAMVTPFDAEGRVDEEAAVRLMNHLVDHGSDGLVVCGTTGEAATLSDEEHIGMVRLAAEESRLVVEPSGALSIAALRWRAREAGVEAVDGSVVAVVSGGNVDPARYRELLGSRMPESPAPEST